MFKRSESKQYDLFNNITNNLSERKQKIFSSPTAWQNIFYEEVLCRIDESMFAVLYPSKTGRSNAPIRVLLGLCILKEGNGWSDEQLFRYARFDLQVLSALGYSSMSDDIPVEATYYSFRNKVKTYHQSTGIDLINLCFSKLTSGQVESYKVNGEKVRLDSKLINSNIRRSTRLEMILEAVRVFTREKDVDITLLLEVMHPEDYKLLKILEDKTVSNITYGLNKTGEEKLLVRLGFILEQLLSYFPNSIYYSIIEQIYKSHYDLVEESSIDESSDQDQSSQPKKSKELKSGSIQSIHDPDAAYRNKGEGAGKQKITGYHANITETCGKDNKVNLILSVEIAQANVSESEFLQPALVASEKVLLNEKSSGKNKIKQVTTDGGYDSEENRKVMNQQGRPVWNMTKHKGRELAFSFSYDKEGQLQVRDAKTKQSYPIHYLKDINKYRIILSNGQRRYYTKKQIGNYLFLQKIKLNQTNEDKKLRPNVEATIHQTFHRLGKRNKIKYRGLIKCKMYVCFRAIWVNFRRILNKNLKSNSFLFVFLLKAFINYFTGINSICQKQQKGVNANCKICT